MAFFKIATPRIISIGSNVGALHDDRFAIIDDLNFRPVVLPVPDGMDERRVLDTARAMAAFFPDKAENPSAQQEVEKVLKAKIYQTVQTFRSLEGDNETRKRGIRHFMNTYLLDAFRARHWDDAAIRKTFQEISPLAHEEGYLDTLMALMEKEK